MTNKTILVTGGAGFIGSHLVDKLIELGNNVKVIDNLFAGLRENINPKADFYELDICDFEKIKPVFQDVDFVFHLAAIPRVPLSMEKPSETSLVNIQGTINVFKAAEEAKVKRIVFASSSSVYGDQPISPLQETMQENPISPYGLQKWVGEKFAKMFTEVYGLPVISLRYFNVFGPRLDFTSDYSLVLGKFLTQKKQGKPMTIFGDGEQTRGFCYVMDVVSANIKAMDSAQVKGGEVINIGSKTSQSVNYIADLLGGEKQYLPVRAGDILHTQADITKAKELLGWMPEVGFEEGVRMTSEWFDRANV